MQQFFSGGMWNLYLWETPVGMNMKYVLISLGISFTYLLIYLLTYLPTYLLNGAGPS
jgi:hypothetical protein